MKKLWVPVLLILLSFLSILNMSIPTLPEEELYDYPFPEAALFDTTSVLHSRQKQSFDIYFEDEGRIEVIQKITTNNFYDTIAVVLNVNMYSDIDSNNNLSRSGRIYNFSRIEVNGFPLEITSCPAVINADQKLILIESRKYFVKNYSNTVLLHYSITLPVSKENFGCSKGGNMCLLTDWYPAVINYKSVWQKDDIKISNKFYDFTAQISVPSKKILAVSGSVTDTVISDKRKIYRVQQQKSSEFIFAVYDQINIDKYVFENTPDDSIEVNIMLFDGYRKYLPRYKNIVAKSLNYLKQNIGAYPFNNLTIAQVPNNTDFRSEGYSNFITSFNDLISPEFTLNPEFNLAKNIAKQYFVKAIPVAEADRWIGESISSYLASKIMNEYYELPVNNFRLASYFPITGLNLLSYNEIPIIYTVNRTYYNSFARDLALYYRNLYRPAISRFYNDPVKTFYSEPETGIKARLAFTSLERKLSRDKLIGLFREIYKSFNQKLLNEDYLVNLLKAELDESSFFFFRQAFLESKIFDYRIRGINRLDDKSFEVIVERLGDGITGCEVALYTDNDTLLTTCDGKSRIMGIRFSTGDKVLAAEIDPSRQNLLDINFANNSYTIETQYWGSLSLAVRTLFWFQNALMIFGSIG
ncbi:MAG: hypothetical protein JW995_04255 [Melioribacteraceae bacterium]|nr:hypothetical protein [Melioribacteraceae bacterium]